MSKSTKELIEEIESEIEKAKGDLKRLRQLEEQLQELKSEK